MLVLPEGSRIQGLFKIALSPEEIVPILASLKLFRHKFPEGWQLFYLLDFDLFKDGFRKRSEPPRGYFSDCAPICLKQQTGA